MPKINVNNIEMYYESHGEGEPIVLIAGFSADHTVWNGIIDGLKDAHQVIVLDNRGAGQTDVPKGPYSIEQMASDVIALCDQLGVDKAHFIGNSMGGYIVQTLAYQYPNRVKSVIISNSTTSTQCGFHLYVNAQLELMKANAPIIPLIKASCSWAFSHQFLIQPGVMDYLIKISLENPYPFSLVGYEGQYAALDNFDSKPWVSNIKVPTLVIGSDEDLIFIEKLIKSLKDQIPHASYYSFENCGHLPFIEYPEQFVNVVLEHISTVK